jgi:predicted PhzF superfamily epimerase YddE/YHI9
MSSRTDRFTALDCRGLIVTAASDDRRFDFISRFFAPKAGIPEDPVTGSAHCALGPYWAQRLGRRALNAWQASRRGGTLILDVGNERVHLAGRAVTTVEGWPRV